MEWNQAHFIFSLTYLRTYGSDEDSLSRRQFANELLRKTRMLVTFVATWQVGSNYAQDDDASLDLTASLSEGRRFI